MTSGPALVLLHGFTNSGASWQPVIAALDHPGQVLAPDLRGHASSGMIRPVTLAAVLADIARLTLGDLVLVGYSQGGRVALHAALNSALSSRIKRLVLIGASPGIADPVERAARLQADRRLAARIETLTIEQFAREWATTPVLAGVSDRVASAAHADRLRSTPAGLAAALRGLGTGALPSLWGRLDELSMPVALITGARDHKFTGIAREMSGLIRRAHHVAVPSAGHAAHLERPAAVAAIIAHGQP